MAEVHVMVGQKIECRRCGYGWAPRGTVVRECPHCHSAKWDIELTEKERERRMKNGREVPAK